MAAFRHAVVAVLLAVAASDSSRAHAADGPLAASTTRAEIAAEVAAARARADAKDFPGLRAHASRIWRLAARLRAAKAPYGRLFVLSRALAQLADGRDADGARAAIESLDKEARSPSAPDAPDDKPKHGGRFLMAPDTSHHVEGTLPDATTFRLWLYDEFSVPLAAEGMAATVTVLATAREGARPTP